MKIFIPYDRDFIGWHIAKYENEESIGTFCGEQFFKCLGITQYEVPSNEHIKMEDKDTLCKVCKLYYLEEKARHEVIGNLLKEEVAL